MDWNVLHVKPRCEKKMAAYCEFCSIRQYLPLRRETKIYQRRKVTVQKPVFPGYVFARLSKSDLDLVVRSSVLARVITVTDQERFAFEIEQVRKALEVDDTLGAASAIAKGKKVRITDGPFRGLEGVVSSLQGATKVVLNVDMIGQGVIVHVETGMLELAE